LLGCQRLSCQRLRDHRVDLGGVEGALGMIDQGLRERENYRLVLLDDRERFLIAVLDEGRATRVGAADDPGEGIGGKEIAERGPSPYVARPPVDVGAWHSQPGHFERRFSSKMPPPPRFPVLRPSKPAIIFAHTVRAVPRHCCKSRY
jgi:hypothetical protein